MPGGSRAPCRALTWSPERVWWEWQGGEPWPGLEMPRVLQEAANRTQDQAVPLLNPHGNRLAAAAPGALAEQGRTLPWLAEQVGERRSPGLSPRCSCSSQHISAQPQALPSCPGHLNVFFRDCKVIRFYMSGDFSAFLVLQSPPEPCIGSSLLSRHLFPACTSRLPIAWTLLGLCLSSQLC